MASKSPKVASAAPEKAVSDVAKTVTDTAIAQVEATKTVAKVAAKAVAAPAEVVAKAVEPVKPSAPAAVKAAVVEAPTKVAAAAKAPVVAAKRKVAKAAAPVAKTIAPVAKAVHAAVVEPVKKAVETAVSAAPKAAPIPQKDVTIMATTFETPKVFTDVSERAKAAFAKSQSAVADLGEFGKGNVEALVESSKIAAKGFETLGQDAADYTRRSFETMTSAFKTLASVKSPTEFFQLQSEYVRSAFDQAVAQSSKNTEAMIKLASDAAQPLSNRFAVAVEKVKTAA